MWQNPSTLLQCKKNSKNENSKKVGPLIEHGPHWINFIIFTFISEKNKYFRRLYKIRNQIIFLQEKKGEI
jgi:hypothetical protein